MANFPASALRHETIACLHQRLCDDNLPNFSYAKECTVTSQYCLLETLVTFFETVNQHIEESIDTAITRPDYLTSGLHSFSQQLIMISQRMDSQLDGAGFDLDMTSWSAPRPSPGMY